jgi:hypothetical protein
MPLKLVVVCEAEDDYRTATALAERVLQAEVAWVRGRQTGLAAYLDEVSARLVLLFTRHTPG